MNFCIVRKVTIVKTFVLHILLWNIPHSVRITRKTTDKSKFKIKREEFKRVWKVIFRYFNSESKNVSNCNLIINNFNGLEQKNISDKMAGNQSETTDNSKNDYQQAHIKPNQTQIVHTKHAYLTFLLV